jgi:ribonuclease Z
MKTKSILLSALLLVSLRARLESQGSTTTNGDSDLRVILLGTAGGPTFSAQRLGISTLILAGPEKLLFDCGRGLTTGMAAMAINPDVTKVFLTHLHSDHIVSLPELYLFPLGLGGPE